MKRKTLIIILITLCIVGVILALFLLNEQFAQIISIISIIIVAAFIFATNAEKSGARQLILMAAPIFSEFLHFFSDMSFTNTICEFYNSAIKFFSEKLGVETSFQLENHTSLIITFWIAFIIIYVISGYIPKWKATKINNENLKSKSYFEKSISFCKTLRQRLEIINKKTDWNESLFTPMEAEIEACFNGKHKKKYTDLLRCLKKNSHNKTVFLVLGDPGSGKSVAMRKLCLDMLDKYKKRKKIPVYIDLKKWNKNWNLNNLPTKKDLLDFIKTTLYEDGDIFTDEFLDCYFSEMYEAGIWYFVFDSFDELPCLMGKQGCQELIDHISEIIYSLITGPDQNGGVIASRLYKSPSDSLGATITLKIQEFNEIKIKAMINKYLPKAQEIVTNLFGNREDLVVLCRNPFYLSLLINYIRDNGVKFPQSQMELYNNFVSKRLSKCIGKIESEQMTTEEVHNAAKKLALHMQASTLYGLECPAKDLYSSNKQYWQKALTLLEYAKICKFSGINQTISFVHRRFQEFFVVENIIENNGVFNDYDYSCISDNSGMRDALVLYCEIAEEKEVRKIAKYCWDIVLKNIKHKNSIHNNGCVALVNTLYFMSEAFRNRKSVIDEFLEDFEILIEKSIDKNTDFVVLHALTNSMVLFEQKRLQQMVLNVFKLNNRWLSDVVVQNCRIMKKIDSRIKSQFCRYFKQINLKAYFEQFRNVQFSLSLSKSLRYIKFIHLSLLISYISLMVLSAISIIIFFILFFVNAQSLTDINLSSLFQIAEPSDTINLPSFMEIIRPFILLVKNHTLFALFFAFLIIFFIDVCRNKKDFTSYIFCSTLIVLSSSFGLIAKKYEMLWMYIVVSIALLSIVINVTTQAIHNVYYAIKEKRFKFPWKNLILSIITLFVFIVIIAVAALILIILLKCKPLLIIIICSFILLIIASIVMPIIPYLRDHIWLSKHHCANKISREQFSNNLKKLNTKKYTNKYLDTLIENKVILTGEWPDKHRPKFKNDELIYKLSKLDCANINNLHERI